MRQHMGLDQILAGLRTDTAEVCRRHLAACGRVGIPVAVTSGWRSPEQQIAEYTKGRVLVDGLWTVADPKKVVTNALPDHAPHCRGAAYDIVPIVAERAAWDRLDLFQKVGEIGEGLGLVWGGRWPKLKDMPHFELPGWRLLPIKET